MVAGQQVRARLFHPLLVGLARARAKPDHITLLSLLFGLAFCPAYFYSLPLAWACLALHVLLDGLDGPLARHLGVASNKGSFTDTMADQAVITASTGTLMVADVVGVLPGTVYIAAYNAVVLFAFMRNMLDTPYAWLLRPRFYVYVWLVVEAYWLPGTLDWVLWLASAPLVLKFFTGFYRIRSKL